MINADDISVHQQRGFKIVCSHCGSLSIKVIDMEKAIDTTELQCGGCTAIRGTLADLNEMARRSTDAFEF